ncbi:MAG: hypothetical protein IPH82_13400 [Chloroflexi bacterium]|nr:hypothetical protein [Chloroflexota bacterium]
MRLEAAAAKQQPHNWQTGPVKWLNALTNRSRSLKRPRLAATSARLHSSQRAQQQVQQRGIQPQYRFGRSAPENIQRFQGMTKKAKTIVPGRARNENAKIEEQRGETPARKRRMRMSKVGRNVVTPTIIGPTK